MLAGDKPKEEDAEADFRRLLEDAAALIRKLAPHCKTWEELIEMLEHGIVNAGQLRLLIKVMTEKK